MHFHLIARPSDDRLFVTLGAGICIEQRAKAVLRLEDPLERLFPFLELTPLGRGQICQRLTQPGLFLRPAPN